MDIRISLYKIKDLKALDKNIFFQFKFKAELSKFFSLFQPKGLCVVSGNLSKEWPWAPIFTGIIKPSESKTGSFGVRNPCSKLAKNAF